jgi:hypothetical protein
MQDEIQSKYLPVRHGIGCLWTLALASLAIIYFSGCLYKGAKVTEGVDFSAGVSIPQSEGVAQVSFVNYLSGFRFGVAENSGMECEYFGTNTFSFAFGLYEGVQTKHFRAKVEPCEVNTANEREKEDEKK